MSRLFTKQDRDFLRAVGIDAQPTFDESRLELAERISRHAAPCCVRVDPDAARRALVRLALERLLKAEQKQ